MLPGNNSNPSRCPSAENLSSVLAGHSIGQEPEEPSLHWQEFVVGEAIECHIYMGTFNEGTDSKPHQEATTALYASIQYTSIDALRY